MALLSTDFIDLALGPDGDLAFAPNGDLAFSSGLSGVAQAVRLCVLMVKGEWFADLDLGVPWFEGNEVTAEEALLGQKFDARKAQLTIVEALQGAPGVTRVIANNVSFNGVTRTLSVKFSVQAEFGDVVSDQVDVSI